jgi:filamentous hemagglutinin
MAKRTDAIGREIKLANGFYQAANSMFKFSQCYYDKLWLTGRGAPYVQAEELLSTLTAVTADHKTGFSRYTNGKIEMVYNPTSREVWHLQPRR